MKRQAGLACAFSFARTRMPCGMLQSSPSANEGAGARGSAPWVVPVSGLGSSPSFGGTDARSHAPPNGRLSRGQIVELAGYPRAFSAAAQLTSGCSHPWGFSSSPPVRFRAQGFSEPPWTLRFHAPEAMHVPFASPRSEPLPGTKPQNRFTAAAGLLISRCKTRHADHRPFIPKLRTSSKPPSERARTYKHILR